MLKPESYLDGEPGLEDLLDGEPCRLLMARDGLSRESVLREARAVANRLSCPVDRDDGRLAA